MEEERRGATAGHPATPLLAAGGAAGPSRGPYVGSGGRQQLECRKVIAAHNEDFRHVAAAHGLRRMARTAYSWLADVVGHTWGGGRAACGFRVRHVTA